MRRAGRAGLLILSILSLLALALPAWAATYYSSTSGSGSTCSIMVPCSLTGGLAKLTSCDTLLLLDGTYNAQIYNQIPSGTMGCNTTVGAANRRQAILLPTSPVYAQGVVEFYNLARSYITIDGLVLDGSNVQDIDIIASDGNDSAHVATFITITNSTVQNGTHADSCMDHVCATNGIANSANGHTFSYTSSWTITDNICDTIGYLGHAHCVYMSGGGNTIKRNKLRNTQGYCVQSYNASFPPSDNIIEQNEMSNCSLGSGDAGYNGTSAITLVGGTGHVVRNNIIFNGCDGIQSTASSSSIDHNTFYANTKCTGGSHADLRITSGSGMNMRNNICYGSTSCTIEDGASGTTKTGNLNDGTNPMFTNAAAHDFTLTALSPAIDTVSCPATVTNDYVGNPRPVGALCDKGAYEYGGTTTPPVIPSTTTDSIFKSAVIR